MRHLVSNLVVYELVYQLKELLNRLGLLLFFSVNTAKAEFALLFLEVPLQALPELMGIFDQFVFELLVGPAILQVLVKQVLDLAKCLLAVSSC